MSKLLNTVSAVLVLVVFMSIVLGQSSGTPTKPPNPPGKDKPPYDRKDYNGTEYFEKNGTLHVKEVSRHCIDEDEPPSFELPLGVCMPRNDSCKHELVELSNGRHIMCDTETDGGGWIIVQRRRDFRGKNGPRFNDKRYFNYRDGFGDEKDNFWLGLESMHRLCPPGKPCDMRTDLIIWNGYEEYVKHRNVTFAGAWDNYRIRLEFDERTGKEGPNEDLDGLEFHSQDHPGNFGHCVHSMGGWWHNYNCTTTSFNMEADDHFRFSEIKLRRTKDMIRAKPPPKN